MSHQIHFMLQGPLGPFYYHPMQNVFYKQGDKI